MKSSPANRKKQILVLGIGNLLMGDEGVGIHAVRYMENHTFPDQVTLLDGGTGGFNLLSSLEDYDPVIIVDATSDGNSPGTLRVRELRYSYEFPATLGAHDIGLKDLIESAILSDRLPHTYLIAISIHLNNDLTMDLTPKVAGILPDIENKVREILDIYT